MRSAPRPLELLAGLLPLVKLPLPHPPPALQAAHHLPPLGSGRGPPPFPYMDHVLSDASARVYPQRILMSSYLYPVRYNEKEVAALGTFIDYQRLYMRATEVGKRVRQVREKLRLTQGEFARRLGVTRVSVARYEAGRVPSFGVLHQLARLGGVTIGWLLQETPEEESPRDWGDRLSPLDVPEAATSFL